MKIDATTFAKLPDHLKALFIKAPNPGSDEVLAGFPVTGASKSTPRNNGEFKSVAKGRDLPHVTHGHDDNGGSAARFFYCAKASKRDRDEGLEGMPTMRAGVGDQRPSGSSWERRAPEKNPNAPRANIHPTVKPTDLMAYLCRLVTPPGGIVLDPFMGSGSTGKAAVREGFKFVGIEREADYMEISRARIENAQAQGSLLLPESPSAAVQEVLL